MKLLFYCLVSIFLSNANATMRIVCGAHDLVVGVECSDRKSITQYFKAEFEKLESGTFAYASSPSIFSSIQ